MSDLTKTSSEPSELKRALTPLHLWAIGVGLVISGEYFGWNYGWGVAGTGGFLLATLVITVLYVTLVFSLTELATSIPHAGGPFAYSYRALGPVGGLIAGYAAAIEFLLATPAIAAALGAYLHFLHPSLPVLGSAIAVYAILTGVNLLGIQEAAWLALVITLLALVELLVYMALVAPSFETATFAQYAMPYGWHGVLAALPFAMWLYVCIEGLAVVAEEAKDPARTVPRGYLSAILTLVLLAFGVVILTAGVGDPRKLATIDYPLLAALASVLGSEHGLTRLFAGIGLFGLIASFNGIIIAYSRQIFALARSGYLPGWLARVSPKRQVPHAALIAGGLFGVAALCAGRTDQLVVLSVLGAVVMYICSLVTLFVLRRREPALVRPYAVPFYPWCPLIALVLSCLVLGAIVYYNPRLSALFFGMLAVAVAVFVLAGKARGVTADAAADIA